MAEKLFQTFQIANFTLSRTYSQLGLPVVDQLKKHLLDSLGSMIHCLQRPTIQKLSRVIAALDGNGGPCRLPCLGGVAADRAAQFFTALIRYPDFMDNFLGKEATCHPSDNIGSLLAAAQLVNASGKEFLLAMATGYEIECRLIEEIPVMIKGFDHTLLLAYSLTAELSQILRLTKEQTANALSMAGSSFNPLVTCRASYTREWKGLQSSLIALGCMNIVLLAREGMTGPVQIFEGPKGFTKEFGLALDYDWDGDRFDLIPKCILKGYNAEVHTQSLIEAALELKSKNGFAAADIERISLHTFLTAYHIVGGGEYGDRKTVASKEQADHSLPYVIAASLLDGELYPGQLLPERINRADVQELLKKVEVNTKFPLHQPVKIAGVIDPYTRAYPEKMMGEVTIRLKNGEAYSLEKEDYYGFHTRPMSWPDVKHKFRRLTAGSLEEMAQEQIISLVETFEDHPVKELTEILAGLGKNVQWKLRE